MHVPPHQPGMSCETCTTCPEAHCFEAMLDEEHDCHRTVTAFVAHHRQGNTPLVVTDTVLLDHMPDEPEHGEELLVEDVASLNCRLGSHVAVVAARVLGVTELPDVGRPIDWWNEIRPRPSSLSVLICNLHTRRAPRGESAGRLSGAWGHRTLG